MQQIGVGIAIIQSGKILLTKGRDFLRLVHSGQASFTKSTMPSLAKAEGFQLAKIGRMYYI
jgi:hypothetical protein